MRHRSIISNFLEIQINIRVMRDSPVFIYLNRHLSRSGYAKKTFLPAYWTTIVVSVFSGWMTSLLMTSSLLARDWLFTDFLVLDWVMSGLVSSGSTVRSGGMDAGVFPV